jgi:predicted small lipoprotein YifL
MNKSLLRMLFSSIVIVLLTAGIAACGSKGPTAENSQAAATTTPTPDRCAPANVPAEFAKVTRLMRSFDEVSVVAQVTPNQQLAVMLLEMNRIRDEATDQEVPPCLDSLKGEKVKFMNAVVATMTNFLGGASGQPLQQRILASRNQRTNYEIELGKLLGYEYHTPTPWPTPTATQVTPTSTPAALTVATQKDIYVFDGPTKNYQKIGAFMTGQQANVTGRPDLVDWIQVELWDSPDHKGWVPYTEVVVTGNVFDAPVVTVPIVTPQP